MERRVAMKLLINEGVNPVDIYKRFQEQYVVEKFSRSKTFEWFKRSEDGCPRMVHVY